MKSAKNEIAMVFDRSGPESDTNELFSQPYYGKLSNRRILVVEDDPVNQAYMKLLFQCWNVSADICKNGKEAIGYLRRKSFDIVLTDLEMPEMNGFETVEHIRNEMRSSIPVIAITANTDTVTRHRALACGMDDYILKPVNPDILFSKMTFHLRIESTL